MLSVSVVRAVRLVEVIIVSDGGFSVMVGGSFGWADIVVDSIVTAPRSRLGRAGGGSGLERDGEIIALGNEQGATAISSAGSFVRTKRSK